MIRPVLLLFDARNEISPHHVRSVQGRLSWKRKNSEVSYENMRGVEASQNVIERILGVGTIKLWTAISDTPEIVMKGIDDPDSIAKLIQQRIDKSYTGHKIAKSNGRV
jgi:uncharacterized membrane protein YdbT with pleckstrin-like domain